MRLAAALYAGVTLLLLRDVLRHPTSHIAGDLGDPLLSVAILGWNARTLPLTEAWWQFPSFTPTPDATAFTEHLLLAYPIASPIVWLTGSAVLAYNVVMCVAFLCNGLAARQLALEVTASEDAALVGGAAFAFAPFFGNHLAHLQLMLAAGMPLALLGLHRFVASGRRRDLVLFAGGFLLTAASSAYALAFFPMLVLLWICWFTRPPRLTVVSRILMAGCIAMLPLVPLLAGYQTRLAEHNLQRTYGQIRQFSADIAGVTAVSSRLVLWPRWLPVNSPENAMFPGAVTAALTLVAIAGAAKAGRRRSLVSRAAAGAALAVAFTGGWRVAFGQSATIGGVPLPDVDGHRLLMIALLLAIIAAAASARVHDAWRRRDPAPFYAGAAVLLFLFALGPEPAWNGVRALTYGPYRLLVDLPLAGSVRAASRFWYPAIICLGVTTALGAAALISRVGARRRAMALAVVALIVAEGWFRADASAVPGAIAAIPRGQPETVVLELPLGHIETDTTAQHRAVQGGYRVVNGYSGYQPADYTRLVPAMAKRDAAALNGLRTAGPLFVVVNRVSGFAFDEVVGWIASEPGAERMAATATHVVFRLPPLTTR